METKQKFTKVKPGLGRFHYEKQLLKQHRNAAIRYLIENGYCLKDRQIIMAEYDHKVELKNIIDIHTHYLGYFFDKLCTGNISDLIKNTTCKTKISWR